MKVDAKIPDYKPLSGDEIVASGKKKVNLVDFSLLCGTAKCHREAMETK